MKSRSQAHGAAATEDFFYEVTPGKPRAACTLSGTAFGRKHRVSGRARRIA
ncbi:hypothetical protein [Caballeronia sp. NK8]|uniref:hypothetical protein n=1 Tax=Caballeronia sp. NK8 TaxID=140098 RepID=UPI001BCE2AE2|nr:hypothetical protein [Caballeronia sp. NK8]